MPGKHDHHDHKPKRKPDGPPRGPKERELAVELTVAVLRAANVSGSLEDVEKLALGTYERMFAAITKDLRTDVVLPPTVQM
jgi:hypothetical protein